MLSKIPGLSHGVFARHGGVSKPPFATLNLAWNIGDSQDAVHENALRVKNAVGVRQLAASLQVHGDKIHAVDEEALEKAKTECGVLLMPAGDALATQLPGVGLMIKIADCQAIFLVDPVRRVIANVHCGWRGSVQELPVKAVTFLEERFGCRPADLFAAISPSLGPCCAEFRNYRDELPASFLPFQSKPLHFDFWAISRKQLTDCGVKPQNIETADRCTVCETRDFFSFRGEGDTGRMAAVIAWREEL